MLLLLASLGRVAAKSIVINGESHKDFKIALFNKYEEYFEIALQIDKKITAKRARAYVLYLYIPKKLILNQEDKTVTLTPLAIEEKKLANSCIRDISIEDKNQIYYFFGDMDSTSFGTGEFKVKGYMQVGELGTGTISLANIEIENQDEPDYTIGFNTVIDLDLTATKFKRRIKAGPESICQRTDTKFADELTMDYAVDLTAKLQRYVYVVE